MVKNERLSIIIVNWNTKDLLRNCLVSIYKESKSISLEIFVIDNASSDGSSEMVKREFPLVKLIRNRKNVGFARANNQAIKESKGKYILLLNPDTIILDGALDKMVKFMETHFDVGVCGPKLLNKDGSLQVYYYAFPTLWNQLFLFLGFHRIFPGISLFFKFINSGNCYNIREVDFVMGAAFMVRREIIKQIGMLDEQYFMYSEESDWAFRIKKAGWKILYFPKAKIVHYGGASKKKIKMLRELYQSRFYFFRKYHTLLSLFIFRFLVALGAIIRISVGALRSFTFDRAKRKKRLEYTFAFGGLLKGIITGKIK